MTLVIQSHGMGVESQAILERWVHEPETRPFTDWSELIIVTAQVGEEHKNDTIRLMEERTLPLMRKLGIRFVELARRGHLEEDGIVVLQDTKEPVRLHPDGAYKLSDELLASGTVPQFGGEHRCAMKFKAFVIETWMAWEFRASSDVPVVHVFGYNAAEKSRIANSDHHIARHNADRAVAVDRPPLMVFGFNADEIGRINRARLYDGPNRRGLYPLPDWGWDRDRCKSYIYERTGLHWVKSHCSFCPFCQEAAKGLDAAVQRWRSAPEQTAHGMLVEYNSMCFNPRGHLYKNLSLIEVVTQRRVVPVIDEFTRRLGSMQWGGYKVRRIYTKKGKARRCVELFFEGTRAQAEAWFMLASEGTYTEQRGIRYAMFQNRTEGAYPSAEGFYVIAPLFMKTKVHGKVARFNERWNAALGKN